jgi:hypothetical protein
MAFNGRLPCPADGSVGVNTSAFGRETDTLGDGLCTGANFSDGGNVVGGVIPAKSLNLDDSYFYCEGFIGTATV